MANPYADGNFAWYWYQTWLPVIAAIGSLALLVYIFSYPVEKIRETIAKVIGVIAFLGTIPMFQERIGIGVDIVVESMFGLSVIGLIASVANTYIYRRNRERYLEQIGSPESAEGFGIYDDLPPTNTPFGDEPDLTPPQGTLVRRTMQPQAFVMVKSGPQAGTSIPITKGETVIGRSSDADIVLDDELVSRDHARISFADGQFTLVDSDSRGGTIVDGGSEETIVLNPGAEVKLGKTEIVFMQGQSTMVANSSNEPQGTLKEDSSATVIGGGGVGTVMKWIAITGGPGKGKTVQLNEGRTTIGREQVNDIQLSDATVSREHAAILTVGDELKLIDTGSASGTTIDGKPISGGKIVPGDVIQIGQNTMSIVPIDATADPQFITTGASVKTMVGSPVPEGVSAVVVVQSGPDAGESFQLTEGDNGVGRDSSNQVLLTDQSVSRRHAVLRKRKDTYAIYDLDSSSVTRVNDEAVEGTVISTGQELKFGNSTAVIMDPVATK